MLFKNFSYVSEVICKSLEKVPSKSLSFIPKLFNIDLVFVPDKYALFPKFPKSDIFSLISFQLVVLSSAFILDSLVGA